ncbi:MAG TPA: glutathione transferase GstA [Terricaulis sp.]|nr:glutathione transferase GstA [Terricaulis sp.]
MKLYYAPGACSLAPHIIVREANLDVALDKVAFAPERRTEGGRDFYEINPQGAVPTLELDDGKILTEAQVLLQYLAAQAPDKKLLPSEGFAKWRALETLNFIATELHKGIGALFKKPGPEARPGIEANIASRLGLLDGKLGDQDYLLGDFSVADAYAFVTLRWAKAFKIDLSPWPRLEAYFQRVQARPAVQAALAAEGLPAG